MMDPDEINIGNVCVDRNGSIGVVESVNRGCRTGACGLPTFHGRTLDGSYWSSRVPTKLAESIEDYQPGTPTYVDPGSDNEP